MNNEPEHVLDIFLQPGEMYWGDASTRIRTILGSCIALCMWNPRTREGGMSHIMLPTRTRRTPGQLDPRYADEALLMMFDEIHHSSSRQIKDYQIKLFGGGRMFRDTENREIIGEKNTRAVLTLLETYGLKITAESQGGDCHRKIEFTIWNGEVFQHRRHVA
jgi:chemotaxis protein CheD